MGACSVGILEFKCEYAYIDQQLDFFIQPPTNQIIFALYDFLKRSSDIKKNISFTLLPKVCTVSILLSILIKKYFYIYYRQCLNCRSTEYPFLKKKYFVEYLPLLIISQ